ncbi:50S ribosomal protein L19, partial [Patescibacteria group bacterium]|nr:50S ribosomal protein L19 [Patescibacteria group bacterium]
MSNLLIQEIEKKFINKKMPVLRPGYQVRVHQKIKEG